MLNVWHIWVAKYRYLKQCKQRTSMLNGSTTMHSRSLSSWAKLLVFLHWNFFESTNLSDKVTLAFHLLAGRNSFQRFQVFPSMILYKGVQIASVKNKKHCAVPCFSQQYHGHGEVSHICEWAQETNGMPEACSSSFFFRSNSTYTTRSLSNMGILNAPWAMHLVTGEWYRQYWGIDWQEQPWASRSLRMLSALFTLSCGHIWRKKDHQASDGPNWSKLINSILSRTFLQTHEIKRNNVSLHVGAVPSGSPVLSPVLFLYPVKLKDEKGTQKQIQWKPGENHENLH